MTIEWRPDDRQFHLHNGRVSMILRVYEDGSLGGLHLGAPLAPGRSYRHLGPDPFEGFGNRVGDPIPFVYPTSGTGDLRVPALVASGLDGSGTAVLRYAGHAIAPGKPSIAPLPSTYVESDEEADTLTVELVDEHTGLTVDLRFTLFADLPIVARSATLRATRDPIVLRTAMSLSLDLPDHDWVAVSLSGAWAREAHVVEGALQPGRVALSSRRGASGAEHNPFLALRRPSTDEAVGEAIGCSLVYSGNFLAEAEVEPFGTTRIRLGIEPETFAWRLEPGEAFTTPEAVVVWTDQGLTGMSQAFHDLYRSRLARGTWRDRRRPVLLNNWEGDVLRLRRRPPRRDRDAPLATWGSSCSCSTTAGSGTATPTTARWATGSRTCEAADGLDGLGRRIAELGMGFGIWIEPEMVSVDSDLYRAHPDWAIGIPGRPRTESRQQLVLDMSRPDVVDHLAESLGSVLGSAPVTYVKWDMNRNITEPYGSTLPADRQGEFFHRYILGVYDLYERLTTRFPEILFESCASGGGRFDPGMLAFAPQTWTSDDTDAIERLAIQWGTSLVYPPSSMGAHVSAVPNHQTGRVTPLETRAAVAFFGVLGYELDPTTLTAVEQAQVRDQVAFYRAHRAPCNTAASIDC